MLGLPQSTELNRPMPKAQLYKKFELKQAQRDAFDADIARMEIVNFIAPQSLPGIAEGTEVKAVFVVDVELKRSDYDTKNIILISKLIPHRIIFALRHEDKVQLAVYHTKLFTAPWQSAGDVSLSISGLNLDAVWQNIVAFVGELEVAEGNSLTEQIRVDEERTRLMRQIETLERQMRSTSQPRRQRELYSEIKKIKISPMSVSTIQSTIERYRKEINDLSTKIADKRKRAADAQAKADKASADARKSKSTSTIRSKISESERYYKEANKHLSDMANLEKKRAAKDKQLITEEKRLVKAQSDEEKKRIKAQQKISDANERKMKSLTQTVRTVQLEQSKLKAIYPLLTVPSEDAYDVFISHASEDKIPFVDTLVEELLQRGVKVWYDRHVLTWGRSIRQNIDAGLRQSKFAIIVLSEHYIQKYWTQKEFNALFSLGSQLGDFLLPIWHNITPERAMEFSPMLSDSFALKSSDLSVAQISDMFVEKLNYDNNG